VAATSTPLGAPLHDFVRGNLRVLTLTFVIAGAAGFFRNEIVQARGTCSAEQMGDIEIAS